MEILQRLSEPKQEFIPSDPLKPTFIAGDTPASIQPNITVEAPIVNVTLPEGLITLPENMVTVTVEAPQIQVESPQITIEGTTTQITPSKGKVIKLVKNDSGVISGADVTEK